MSDTCKSVLGNLHKKKIHNTQQSYNLHPGEAYQLLGVNLNSVILHVITPERNYKMKTVVIDITLGSNLVTFVKNAAKHMQRCRANKVFCFFKSQASSSMKVQLFFFLEK